MIVIMGEGYTQEQQEQFLKDATAKAQGLLKWSPYKEYSDRINIYAVQTVSNETGVGVMYGESNPDTYFHVQAFGKSCYFAKDGEDKARALRAELESRYLDTGAAVGTIHIIVIRLRILVLLPMHSFLFRQIRMRMSRGMS